MNVVKEIEARSLSVALFYRGNDMSERKYRRGLKSFSELFRSGQRGIRAVLSRTAESYSVYDYPDRGYYRGFFQLKNLLEVEQCQKQRKLF